MKMLRALLKAEGGAAQPMRAGRVKEVSTQIEQILASCEAARSVGEGEWRFEEEPAASLLVELGEAVIDLERVTRVKIRNGVATIVAARETHFLPAERLVGLKVAGNALGPGSGARRAGFV